MKICENCGAVIPESSRKKYYCSKRCSIIMVERRARAKTLRLKAEAKYARRLIEERESEQPIRNFNQLQAMPPEKLAKAINQICCGNSKMNRVSGGTGAIQDRTAR